MKLIFCISNLFIPITLSLIKKNEKDKILLYTDQKGIFEFFKILNFEKVSLYFRESSNLSYNLLNNLKFFIKRDQTLNELKKHSINEIYFFHRAFGSYENWLILKLAKKKKVYYCPVTKELTFEEKFNFKAHIVKNISKFIHNTEVRSLWSGERYILSISDRYLVKINAKNKEIKIDKEFIKNLIENRFSIKTNFEFVLLTGTMVELNQVEKMEYETKIDILIKSIGLKKIIAKPHPRFPTTFSLEKSLDVIPYFIPANVLFSKFKVFIGYSTTVLSEAANEGLVAISLLDYLEPESEERKKKYKEYLTDNLDSGKIHFPRTIEDIISIIKNINL